MMDLNDGYVKLIDKMLHPLLTNLCARRLHYRSQPSTEIRGMYMLRPLSLTETDFMKKRKIFYFESTFNCFPQTLISPCH